MSDLSRNTSTSSSASIWSSLKRPRSPSVTTIDVSAENEQPPQKRRRSIRDFTLTTSAALKRLCIKRLFGINGNEYKETEAARRRRLRAKQASPRPNSLAWRASLLRETIQGSLFSPGNAPPVPQLPRVPNMTITSPASTQRRTA